MSAAQGVRGLRGVIEGPATDDAVLFARLCTGDLDALGTLYDRYQAHVADTVERSGVPAADVEDVVQETFLTLAAHADRYDGRSSARAWILGVAWRVAGHRRRSLRRWLQALVGLVSHPVAPSIDPETAAVQNEALAALDRALAALPDKMRAVFVLVEIEGLSGDEAARALGIPTATVWSRLHYARKRLSTHSPPGEVDP